MPDTTPVNPDPTADPDVDKLAIELPLNGVGSEAFWRQEIERAEARKKPEITKWRENLRRYEGETPKTSDSDSIPVNIDFSNTEQKKSQLFFKAPDLYLEPLQPNLQDAALLFQNVLNNQLGPDGINVLETVEACLFNAVCVSAVGPSIIEYRAEMISKIVPVHDELNQPVIGEDGQPVTQTVIDPVPMFERYEWKEFSPAKLLLCPGFLSTNYDKAPWIGREIDDDPDLLGIDEVMQTPDRGAATEETSLATSEDMKLQRSPTRAYEIFYRAHLFDPDVKNPEKIRRLVLIQGSKRDRQTVKIHEDFKHQRFDDDGRFVRGMRGYPIHPLCIRKVTDQPYPPSDSTISRPQVDELSDSRTQMRKHRRRNVQRIGINGQKIDKEFTAKMESMDEQSILVFDGPVRDEDMRPLATGHYPQENFAIIGTIQRDIDKTWGFGANQQGVSEATGHTATEIATINQAKDERIEFEAEKVNRWYLRGAEKISSLFQLYATHEQLVPIVGEDGTARLETWNKDKIQGRFAFKIKRDSTKRLDSTEEFNKVLRAYNLSANDPYANREALLRKLYTLLGLDPKSYIAKPSEPPPEKPKISIALRGEDLVNPVVVSMLRQLGYQIDPNAVAEAGMSSVIAAVHEAVKPPMKRPQTAHGGAAAQVPPVSKRDADITGERRGVKPAI